MEEKPSDDSTDASQEPTQQETASQEPASQPPGGSSETALGETTEPLPQEGTGAMPPAPASATTALVLSLVGLLFCGPLAIGGIVLGSKVKAEIRSGDNDPSSAGTAKAAVLTGWIAVAIWGLLIVAATVSAILNPKPVDTVGHQPSATPTVLISPASPTPSPSPTMATLPDVTEQQLDNARRTLNEAGFSKISEYDVVYDRSVWNPSNWVVVVMTPAGGEKVLTSTEVRLGLKKKTDKSEAERAADSRQSADRITCAEFQDMVDKVRSGDYTSNEKFRKDLVALKDLAEGGSPELAAAAAQLARAVNSTGDEAQMKESVTAIDTFCRSQGHY